MTAKPNDKLKFSVFLRALRVSVVPFYRNRASAPLSNRASAPLSI